MKHFFWVLGDQTTAVSFEQEEFPVVQEADGNYIVVQPHQVERIRAAEHLRRHLAYGGTIAPAAADTETET